MSNLFYKQRTYIATLLFLGVLFVSSCKNRKLTTADNRVVILDHKSPRELTKLLKKNEFKFDWLTAKFSADSQIDSATGSFSVSMKCRRDSAIWMSFSKFGVEGARAFITRDSVKFIDRIKSQFFSGDYNYVNKILQADIDFELLQSLLIGNSVEFYDDDDTKLRSGIDNKKYFLGTIRKRKMRKVLQKGKELKEPAQSIWLNPESFKIMSVLFKDPLASRTFEAKFENFQLVDSMLFPHKINYTILAEKKVVINVEYSKIAINKPQQFPFSIPSDYEQIVPKKQ